MFKLTPIALALFVTTAINFVISYVAWQRRETRSGTYFAVGMMGVTFWTLASALDYAAVPLFLKIFFAKLEPIGYLGALSVFALFSLSYAGNDEWIQKRWVQVIFVLLPLSSILLIATNELHGWVWKGFKESGNNVVIFEHGPAFSWVLSSSYFFTSTIIINLWLASRKGSKISQRQGRLLLLAILFPIAANLFYLFEIGDIEGVDWTSITFSITGLLFLRALYGQGLLDLVPVARDRLVRNLGDGMIVLDTQNRIIDINQTAAVMINSSIETLLGRELSEIAPLIRPFLELPHEQEIKNELEVGATKKQYFDFLISPLWEGTKKIIGRLIIFRDITERKENELRLLQLTKELQETQAQVIAHERFLAKLEERQRLGRDMHDSVNQSIHSLMLFSETLSALLEKNQIDKAVYIAQRIQESGRQALKEIRLLVFETQSLLAAENLDLISALKERLNMVEHRVGIKSEVICGKGTIELCPPEWMENLYWMTTEALNNSLKHARAHQVSVVITHKEQQMDLVISDDGVGFNPNQIQAGGFGMRTMRERAEILGGQLSVESSPGHGARVHFTAEMEGPHG